MMAMMFLIQYILGLAFIIISCVCCYIIIIIMFMFMIIIFTTCTFLTKFIVAIYYSVLFTNSYQMLLYQVHEI